MSETLERDTRVETLVAGDRMMLMGRWHDVHRVRHGVQRFGPQFVAYAYLDTIDDDAGEHLLFVAHGTFVAADCVPRPGVQVADVALDRVADA